MVQVEFRILSCFFKQDSRHFAEICKAISFPTDLGGYYIRRLVQNEYLAKSQRGTYTITPKGKHQLTSSYGNEIIASRPRLCAMIVARQDNKYIVLARTSQPFIGVKEWPAGMVKYGEGTRAAAHRILEERLGISNITPTFVGIFRRTDIYKDTVFDDKLFAVHTCTVSATTAIKDESITGRHVLHDTEQILALENPSKTLLDILEFVQTGGSALEEHVYQLNSGDLFHEE